MDEKEWTCTPGSKGAYCPSGDYCVSCSKKCKESGYIWKDWLCYKGKWDRCQSDDEGDERGGWICHDRKWIEK